jgi:hypothetical protein
MGYSNKRQTVAQMEALSDRRIEAQNDKARQATLPLGGDFIITGPPCDVRPGVKSNVKDGTYNAADLPWGSANSSEVKKVATPQGNQNNWTPAKARTHKSI